jgi:hypothetical protein
VLHVLKRTNQNYQPIKEVPLNQPGLRINITNAKLRSAALLVAVLALIFTAAIFVLALTAFFRLLLTRLTALLFLVMLSRSASLLALARLIALLTLFLHIVCHKYSLSEFRPVSACTL